MRKFVLISSLFFLSVITFSLSKSWIAIYSLAYPFPWTLLAMSSYSSCSTSFSVVTAEIKVSYRLWIIPGFIRLVQAFLLSQTVIVWGFFLRGCYEYFSSLRQLLLWNVFVFYGSYYFVERKKNCWKYFSMAGGMVCVESRYWNSEKDRLRFVNAWVLAGHILQLCFSLAGIQK